MFAEGIVEGCYLVNNQQKIAKQGKEKRKRKRRSSRPRILKRSRKEYTWALHWPETQRRLWRNKPGPVGLISSQCLADQSVRDLDSRVLKKKTYHGYQGRGERGKLHFSALWLLRFPEAP